ncbi:RDD family protein [Cellulomonas sp. NPDC057328]|uniref:RDD family protein n=1 Tax=Cellulomonas sp. NPDC057328 TaxID=3346101 RepID=UPI003638D6D8
MPLPPEAASCSVCGARVPLIARADLARRASDGSTTGRRTAVPSPPVRHEGPDDRHRRDDLPAPVARRTGDAGATPAPFGPAVRRRAVEAPPVPEPPSVGRRVLAQVVDAAVLGIGAGAAAVAATAAGAPLLSAAATAAVLVAVAQVVAEGVTGSTAGAAALNLRTVTHATGGAPGVGRALVRQLVVGLGAVLLLVGSWLVAASAVFDRGPHRRGWHDRASGTRVVDAATPAAARGPGPDAADRPGTPRDAGHASAPPPAPGAPAAPASSDRGTSAVTPSERESSGPVRSDPEPDPAPSGALTPPTALALDRDPAAPSAWSAPTAPPAWSPPDAPDRGDGPALPAAGGEPDGTDPRPAHRLPDAPVPPAPAPATPLPPPPAAVPEATSPGAHDELVELEHTRVRDPAQLRRRAVTLALLFDTGPRVRVVGRGLAGRGPRAEDGSDILHVVAVDDPSRSVSRVHLEFGPEAPASADDVAGVWVLDRGSTNGTVVVAPDGDARVLPPGTRAVVRAGWTVRLGERVVRVEDD